MPDIYPEQLDPMAELQKDACEFFRKHRPKRLRIELESDTAFIYSQPPIEITVEFPPVDTKPDELGGLCKHTIQLGPGEKPKQCTNIDGHWGPHLAW